MTRVFGDLVDVWVKRRASRPVRLARPLYTVRRVLEHWVTTRDWWRSSIPTARPPASGSSGGRGDPDREIGVDELRYDVVADDWLLSRVWD